MSKNAPKTKSNPIAIMVRNFATAFTAGIRSNNGTHMALIDGLAYAGRNSMNLVAIQKMVDVMGAKAPKAMQTVGIVRWLKTVASLAVDDNGKVTTVRGRVYDTKWLEHCKALPWHVQVKNSLLKAPKILEQNLITAIARGQALELEGFTRADLTALFESIVARGTAAARAPGTQTWVANYRAQQIGQPTAVQAPVADDVNKEEEALAA